MRVTLFFTNCILQSSFDVIANMFGHKIGDKQDIQFSIISRHNRFEYYPHVLALIIALLVGGSFVFKYRKTQKIESIYSNLILEYIDTYYDPESAKVKEIFKLSMRRLLRINLRFKNPESQEAYEIFEDLKRYILIKWTKRQ